MLLFNAVGKCDLLKYMVYDKKFDENGDESNVFPHIFCFPSIMVEEREYVALSLPKGKNNNGKIV